MELVIVTAVKMHELNCNVHFTEKYINLLINNFFNVKLMQYTINFTE